MARDQSINPLRARDCVSTTINRVTIEMEEDVALELKERADLFVMWGSKYIFFHFMFSSSLVSWRLMMRMICLLKSGVNWQRTVLRKRERRKRGGRTVVKTQKSGKKEW